MGTLSTKVKVGRFFLGVVISVIYIGITNLSYRFFSGASSNYISVLQIIIYLAGIVFCAVKTKTDSRYKYVCWGLFIPQTILLISLTLWALLGIYIATNIK